MDPLHPARSVQAECHQREGRHTRSIKSARSFAGHNGLRSIAQHLKTPEFMRLRIGVGRPGRGDPRPLADYVLSNFEPHDDAESLAARAADAVEALDAEGLDRAQAQFN